MDTTAPIIILAYNRPKHTAILLDSLAKNGLIDSSNVFIFCDGSKENATDIEKDKINEVRALANGFKSSKQTFVFEAPANKGLSKAVIEAVNYVLKDHSSVIVLEDDLQLSAHFLEYMNAALHKYKSYEQVYSISGYMFPMHGMEEHFFVRLDASWGWATWQRAWKNFEADPVKLANQLKDKNAINEFNFNGSYRFYEMLQKQINNRVNSWAIRWYASIFLNNAYTLYPYMSLVKNTGHDGSGVHSYATTKYDPKKLLGAESLVFPDKVEESYTGRQVLETYFRKLSKVTFRDKLISRINRFFKINSL